ncbi:transposable element Tc1 transposase [Trichonephila clavipes]|uniref:Transposable element Tc1 transposase n=1 Tax=Trichonephila clavipes TaxID=2585209 RepID=A0A8X6V552_TRICX|nr:transposable element Tc1 transposase [Trichonephila clavipes]
MRPLEYADKNGSTMANYSVMRTCNPHTSSNKTNLRWLIERNLRSYRPLRHLSLTLAHCRGRSQWSLAPSVWNHFDWLRIVFSDKSRFQLCPDNHRRRVWRRPGQSADPAFMPHWLSTRSYDFGCPFFDSWTSLVVIRGALTAQRYFDDILRNVLLSFPCLTLNLFFG